MTDTCFTVKIIVGCVRSWVLLGPLGHHGCPSDAHRVKLSAPIYCRNIVALGYLAVGVAPTAYQRFCLLGVELGARDTYAVAPLAHNQA